MGFKLQKGDGFSKKSTSRSQKREIHLLLESAGYKMFMKTPEEGSPRWDMPFIFDTDLTFLTTGQDKIIRDIDYNFIVNHIKGLPQPTYILKENTIFNKRGDTFTLGWNGNYTCGDESYPLDVILNNPDWFEHNPILIKGNYITILWTRNGDKDIMLIEDIVDDKIVSKTYTRNETIYHSQGNMGWVKKDLEQDKRLSYRLSTQKEIELFEFLNKYIVVGDYRIYNTEGEYVHFVNEIRSTIVVPKSLFDLESIKHIQFISIKHVGTLYPDDLIKIGDFIDN